MITSRMTLSLKKRWRLFILLLSGTVTVAPRATVQRSHERLPGVTIAAVVVLLHMYLNVCNTRF